MEKKFSYFISEIPNFSFTYFFRKCSMFRRTIPISGLKRLLTLYVLNISVKKLTVSLMYDGKTI